MSLDSLHITHAIFQKKMDEFIELRPPLRYLSVRVKRMELLNDEEKHLVNIDASFNNSVQKSKIFAKAGAMEVLTHVRTKMLNHGESFRANEEHFLNQHIWDNIKAKADIWHSSSYYKRLWGKQKTLLSMVGSDLEAQSVVRFIDSVLVARGLIKANEVLGDDHPLLKLDPSTENTLQDLRMLKQS